MRLPDFELERYFARWEFEARHLLCASDVRALSLQELLAMADPSSQELWEKLQLGYGESPGHPLLHEAIAPTPRAIVVNFPHNPTGALPDRATFQALVSLADECGAVLVSDEVYRFLEVDARDRLRPRSSSLLAP